MLTKRAPAAGCTASCFVSQTLALVLLWAHTHAQPDTAQGPTLAPIRIDGLQHGPHPLHEATLQGLVLRADSAGMFPAAGIGVAEALTQAPGVQIRTYGGQGGVQTVALRGFASNQTQVLLNNVPYDDPLTGSVNFANFYLEGLGSVEVAQGYRSPVANPGGGTVRLSTQTRTNRKLAAVGVGAWGEARAALSLQPRNPESRLSYRLDVFGSRADENYPYAYNEEAGRRRNANHGALQAQLHTTWRLGKARPPGQGLVLDYFATGFRREQQVPGPIVKGNPDPPQERFARANIFHYVKLSNADFRNGRVWQWAATMRHQADRLDFRFLNTDSDYRVQDVLAQAEARLQPRQDARQRITLVGQAQHSSLWGSRLQTLGQRLEFVDRKQAHVAAEYKIQHQEGFSATAMARMNFIEGFSPKLNVAFLLEHHKNVMKNYIFSPLIQFTRSTRLPSFGELYFLNYGNPALDIEKAWVAEGGFLVQPNPRTMPRAALRLSAGASVFYNHTQDKILAVPLSPVRLSTQQLGHTEAAGVQVQTSVASYLAPRASAQLWANYTYQDARDRSLAPGALLPYTPRNVLNAGLQLTWRGWHSGLAVARVGARFSSLQNDGLTHMPAYWVPDAYVQHARTLGRWRLVVRASAQNFTNENYAVLMNYPMPGFRPRLDIRLGW